MERKDNFSADALSETDRIAALNKIINEFEALKGAGGDEHIHKRRKMLLSLWGELVLARKDPTVSDRSEGEPADLKKYEQTISVSDEDAHHAHQIDGAAGHQHEEPASEELAAAAHETHEVENSDATSELVAAEEPATLEVHETHESEAAPSDESDLETAAHAIESGEAAVTTHDVQNEHEDHETIHGETQVETVEAVDDDSRKEPIEVLVAESHPSEPIVLLIAEIDEKSDPNFIIQDTHEGLERAEPSDVVIASPEEPIDAALAKIFDVQPQDEKPLIEIEDVKTEQAPLVMISPISESQEVNLASNFVRLRLLKTGVLHDVVLPEGTVVSTNPADAEELIASGTAERLLIQNNDEDDDF